MIKYFILLLILVGCAGNRDLQNQEASAKCTNKACEEMSSCSEALFNFLQCGREELDKDGDGQPCETVCKKQ
jgi:hypothetical protein